MAKTRQIIGGGKYGRELYGITVTFENSEGRRFTFHERGKPDDILRRMCAQALALDETFRLIAYSTPQTIYTDMDGGRADKQEYEVSVINTLPEMAALARINLRYLLHPRLQAQHRLQDTRVDASKRK